MGTPLENNTAKLQAILNEVSALPSEAVLYSEQALSDEQKAQARENIGAEERTKTVLGSETALTLADNTEYRLTDISSLTLNYPDGDFEVWLNIQLSSTGVISVTFPDETLYIGAEPAFNNGQVWEISIKDGVAVCWRVK